MAEYSNINGSDDKAEIIKWMTKGHVDTKGFAKHLPNTTADLRDGRVTPEQIADELLLIYESGKIEYDGSGGVVVSHEDFFALAFVAAKAALPDKIFQRSALTRDDGRKIFEQFSPIIYSLLIDKSKKRAKPGKRGDNAALALILKESVDEACEKMADQLDKDLFRGKKGVFLKKCPLYGIEPRRYSEYQMPLGQFFHAYPDHPPPRDGVGKRKMCLLNVAVKISQGHHELTNLCWQCAINCEGLGIKECAKCRVAVYCSRKCQVAAWKEGHKRRCGELRSKEDAFQALLREVRDSHRPGNLVAQEFGVPPCEIVFYKSIQRMMMKDDWVSELETKFGKPSVRNFYQNLKRVIDGDWWVCNEADSNYQTVQKNQEQEYNHLLAVAYCLCFDVVGHFTLANAMPSDKFVNWCSQSQFSSSKDMSSCKRECINMANRLLKENFHK